MALVTVIAIQPFTHQGRLVHKGEAVTLEALEAAAYAEARRVTLDRSARATYRTTDLTAAPPVPVPVASRAAAPEPDVPPEPTPARTRRRRRASRA